MHLIDNYDVEDGERPEHVAYKIYGDTNYFWIVCLMNNIENVYYDWPLSSVVFEQYLKDKYTNPEAIHHYEKIQSSGKIAMKLSDDDKLIGVHTCIEKKDDVFLSTKEGKCLRFPISNVRKFSGRNSVGVRGIRLSKDDMVISMYILKHAKFTIDERNDYLKIANAIRRKELRRSTPFNKLSKGTQLSENKFVEMENIEEFILSIADNGFGKRSSAYEYRITSRGGKGIANMSVNKKIGKVVSSFPVNEKDDIMLIAGTGKLIRSPVNKIRISGRTTQGVTLFKVESSEKVLSAASIKDLNINSEE